MDLPCIAATAKPAAVLGAVLAGGRARRLGGGDKALQMLGGRPLLDHVLDRLRPQLGEIVLNANGDPARFAGWKLPVVPDVLDGQGGPLVGVLSCLDWTRANRPGINVLVTVPCDTPFLPEDLIGRLLTARAEAGTALAVARSRGRLCPVVALWPVAAAEALRRMILDDQVAKAERGLERLGYTSVDFEGGVPDPFMNLNTSDDLRAAERSLTVVQG